MGGAGSLWLFLCLGIAGSAAPAHFGFRVLAHRQHLDRGYPFAPGTEEHNHTPHNPRGNHTAHAQPNQNKQKKPLI